jgi:hypothetical protein
MLATLVFLGAFVPVIGSVIAGAVAVLVALVTNGAWSAVIVLAVVVGVMQIESHVLQALLLGRAVRLHPRDRAPDAGAAQLRGRREAEGASVPLRLDGGGHGPARRTRGQVVDPDRDGRRGEARPGRADRRCRPGPRCPRGRRVRAGPEVPPCRSASGRAPHCPTSRPLPPGRRKPVVVQPRRGGELSRLIAIGRRSRSWSATTSGACSAKMAERPGLPLLPRPEPAPDVPGEQPKPRVDQRALRLQGIDRHDPGRYRRRTADCGCSSGHLDVRSCR